MLVSVILAHAQSTTDSLSKKFFDLYDKAGPDAALNYLFGTNPFFEVNKEGVEDVKIKLSRVIKDAGSFRGYELLSTKSAGQHLQMQTYIIRYDAQPITFRMMFYKPSTKWLLQNFQFKTDIDDELEEASKVKETSRQ